MAIVARPDGRPVPGIAPAAKQEGAYVAKAIRARLGGQPAPPFRYQHAGDLATIGKRRAVIDFGWIKLRGAIAWWLWGFAHIYFLIGVRNRLSVALNWLWIYARDQRSARLITQGGGRGGGLIAFDMAGAVPALELAYAATARGGTTVTAGLPPPDKRMALGPVTLVAEERTLKGSYIGSAAPLRDVPRAFAEPPVRPRRLGCDGKGFRLHAQWRP